MAEPSVEIAKKAPTLLALDPNDRLKLLQLAADVSVREQELKLALVRLETARLMSDAAGNAVTKKMGVPDAAVNVRIDNNTGFISYEMPE
jgi:hypothetical protein